MKVAIVSPGGLPLPAVRGGAVEVLSDYLIDGFINNDNEVDCYTIHDEQLNNIKKNNLNIIQIKVNFFLNFLYRIYNHVWRKLKKEIKFSPYTIIVPKLINKKDYDLIIVENNVILYKNIIKNYNKNNHFKSCLHLHNTINEKQADEVISSLKFANLHCDYVFVVSEFLKKHYSKYIDSNKLFLLYNCIDFNIFDSKHYKKSNNKDFTFMYFGRITEEKGILELIFSFKELCRDYSNIKLMVVGSGWFDSSKLSNFEEQIRNEIISIKDKVEFTGFVDHDRIPEYLNIADCVVIPSKCDEAFGVVAIEAMAMKKTIISSNSGGLVEPLNNECSVIIDRNNLKELLYINMKNILVDKDLSNQMANNAYNRVHEIKEFNKDYYYDSFIKYIK